MAASANVTSTGTLIAAGPVTLVGIYISNGAAAGSVVLKDGGASGTTKLTVQTPASATTSEYIDLKGGIPFGTDVHATISNAVGVTVITSSPSLA